MDDVTKEQRKQERYRKWREYYHRRMQEDPEWAEKQRSDDRKRQAERLVYNQERAKKNPAVYMHSRARQRALLCNVPFTITVEDIVVPTHCPLLGIELVVHTGRAQSNSPSIDRKVPHLGYTPENIGVISKLANVMKNSASIEQLLEFSGRIKAYMYGGTDENSAT